MEFSKSKSKRSARSTQDDLKIHSDLGALLKQYRIFKGFTRLDVANHLNISVQQVHKYEAAINRISAVTLFRYLELLHVSFHEIYSVLFKKTNSEIFDVDELHVSEGYSKKDTELAAVMKLLVGSTTLELKGLKYFLHSLRHNKPFEEK